MYGLINQAIKDLVLLVRGEAAWATICGEAGLEPIDFEMLTPYPEELSSNLLTAAAAKLSLTNDEFLKDLGRHWIIFTGERGYGEMLDLLGRDLATCLKNLNHMHAHLGAMMPDLRPPTFSVTELSEHLFTVHYHSSRVGLAPMVIGLLEGLANRLGQSVKIELFPKGLRSDHDEFDVTIRS